MEVYTLKASDIVSGQDFIKETRQLIKQRRLAEASRNLTKINDIFLDAKRI